MCFLSLIYKASGVWSRRVGSSLGCLQITLVQAVHSVPQDPKGHVCHVREESSSGVVVRSFNSVFERFYLLCLFLRLLFLYQPKIQFMSQGKLERISVSITTD